MISGEKFTFNFKVFPLLTRDLEIKSNLSKINNYELKIDKNLLPCSFNQKYTSSDAHISFLHFASPLNKQITR